MAKKKWFETPEFLKQRWAWYEKVKASGLKDIEYHDYKSGKPLPVLSGFSQMDANRYYRADAAEYYRIAEHRLITVAKAFGENSWQYKVWQLHSQGFGVATVVAKLGHPTVSPTKIGKFIRDQKKVLLRGPRANACDA